MKKRLLFTVLIGMFLFVNPLMAQEDSSATENVEMMAEGAEEMDSSAQEEVQMEEAVEKVVTEVEEAIAPVEEAEDDVVLRRAVMADCGRRRVLAPREPEPAAEPREEPSECRCMCKKQPMPLYLYVYYLVFYLNLYYL